MLRSLLAARLVPLALVVGLVACSESVAPRPRAPDGLLAPSPRGPAGQPQPVDSTGASLGQVHPATVTIDGLPPNAQLTVGTTAALTVRAWDVAGRPLGGFVPVWSVSDTTVATIDSSGVLTATHVGAVKAGVFVNDTTAWVDLAVVPVPGPTPGPPPPPPPPPASPGSIVLAVVRFDGGTGAATVSAGIPLAPGALRPGQESLVRVSVGGIEQPAYVAGLSSVHPDGSLRTVLVQFQVAALGPVSLDAQLDIGTARADTMTLPRAIATPGAAVPGVPLGLPQAAALPADPKYLVTTDLAGATTISAASTALGGVFARYESDFTTYGAKLWTSEGAEWGGNYYDRALIYYAMWVRTGNPIYWARAGQIAYQYRTKYLEPNNYGSSPHWSQLEGLEKHYLLTGDEASRTAVVRTANVLHNAFINTNYMTRVNGESRIAARVLHAQLLAWRLTGAGSAAVPGISSSTNWGARLEAALAKVVVWQQPDGSYPADGQACGGQLNYMVGLLNDALIKTYDYYQPATTARAALQSQIQTLVNRAVDYMWNTQWIAAKNAFQYMNVACSGVGGTTPSPDLNNLIVTGFGWLYQRTGDAKYRAAGEVIFAGGVSQAFLSGSKQFNEAYTSSFRYLGYR